MAKSLKEYFNPGRTVSNLGALRFRTSVFRDETRYPHWEMDHSIAMFEQRPQVNSGIQQFVSFIIGEEIKATSEDRKSQDFLQKWIDLRSKTIKGEMRKIITSTVICGNGYVEPSYMQTPNGVNIIDNIFSITDSSRVYYNLDTTKTDNEYWIYEVPIEIKVFPWRGEPIRPKFYRVNYVRGSILWQKMVYGIAIHKDKIKHLKIGWSRDGIYGRGFLNSAIDDGDIQTEILKNLAIISRSRALNLKVLTIGSEEDKATPEDVERLESQFKTRKEDEHMIVNKPVKEINLSHQGQYDKMDDVLQFLQKDIGSGLVPNFLTPWNSDVNRATAGEVKIPFQLQLNDYREEVLNFFNELIVDNLRLAYPWLAQDAKIDFSQVDLTSTEEKMTHASEMFSSNVISLNEYRIAAGYDRVVNGDVFAYQLPSLPVDQITQRVDPPKTDGGMPKQNGTGESMGPFKPKNTMSEMASISEAAQSGKGDEQTFDEVFTELYELDDRIEKFMKKHGTTRKIKTLENKDKKTVQELIFGYMGIGRKKKLSVAEFVQKLKDDIQKYSQGEPKYDYHVIERIARTELSNARELNKLLNWKEAGFSKVTHITHVRPNSGKKDIEYNQKIFDIDHLLTNEKDRIPLHPNCRCVYALHE